jgi:hypothetical protein
MTVTLSASQVEALCDALPRATTFDTAIGIVDVVRRELVGSGLLTVNLRAEDPPEADVIALERIWTSDPEAYPVAGRKLKPLTSWTRQLLVRGDCFIGEGADALARVFDDHERIASLGLAAVVNVPLFDEDARCFATFNVLGPAARWKEEQVAAVRLLAALATPAVLREASRRCRLQVGHAK